MRSDWRLSSSWSHEYACSCRNTGINTHNSIDINRTQSLECSWNDKKRPKCTKIKSQMVLYKHICDCILPLFDHLCYSDTFSSLMGSSTTGMNTGTDIIANKCLQPSVKLWMRWNRCHFMRKTSWYSNTHTPSFFSARERGSLRDVKRCCCRWVTISWFTVGNQHTVALYESVCQLFNLLFTICLLSWSLMWKRVVCVTSQHWHNFLHKSQAAALCSAPLHMLTCHEQHLVPTKSAYLITSQWNKHNTPLWLTVIKHQRE